MTILYGTSGNNSIDMANSFQNPQGLTRVDGQSGNDSIYGAASADSIFGNSGNDYLYGDGKYNLTSSADTLDGGLGADYLYGGNGNDRLQDGTGVGSTDVNYFYGEGGNDTLTGSGGRDYMYGGDDADSLSSSAGYDNMYGGNGNDQIQGNYDGGWVDGGAGNDMITVAGGTSSVVFGGDDSDFIRGSFLNETINGDNQADSIYAGGDTVYANSGRDYVYGGQGNDLIYGEAGDDVIYGEAGSDTLSGGSGNDYLDGGEGDDVYYFDGSNEGYDFIADGGNTGYDVIRAISNNTVIGLNGGVLSGIYGIELITAETGYGGYFSNVRVVGTAANENKDFTPYEFRGIANITLGDGNDSLTGSYSADRIYGDNGDDMLGAGVRTGWGLQHGDWANDSIYGGAGTDIGLLAGTAGDYTIADLGAYLEVTVLETGEVDRYYEVESLQFADNSSWTPVTPGVNLVGTSAADILPVSAIGGDGADSLTGMEEADKLVGGKGDDLIYGAAAQTQSGTMLGADTISGGDGADQIYALGRVSAGANSVTGDAGADKIWVSGVESAAIVSGGAGTDIFTIDYKGGPSGGNNWVQITDFDPSAGERIVLHTYGSFTPDLTGYHVYDDPSGLRIVLGAAPGQSDVYLVGKTVADFDPTWFSVITSDTWSTDPSAVNVPPNDAWQVLNGTSQNDSFDGGRGEDTIIALGGDDSVQSGWDNDSVDGGDGADTILNAHGLDTLAGGNGNDTIQGGSETDVISGGAGNDQIDGGTGAGNSIHGDGGADWIISGDGWNLLDGGSEADTISGGYGSDSISGGTGDDYIYSVGNATTTVFTATGADTILGGDGNDTIIARAQIAGSFNSVDGGAGADQIVTSAALTGNRISGGIGADIFTIVFDGLPSGFDNWTQIFDFDAAQGDQIVLQTGGAFTPDLSSGNVYDDPSGVRLIIGGPGGQFNLYLAGHTTSDFSAGWFTVA